MNPRSPWTQKVVEILGDGRWHFYNELVNLAGPLIPPGRARRHAEKARARGSSTSTGPAANGRVRPADALAVGRRGLVVQSIHKLGVSGVIEVDVEHHRARKASA